ncbi:MAG: hypothetical protein ACLP1W_08050 [Rhodomicrobium sp.]
MLVAISRAFDLDSIDKLIFLEKCENEESQPNKLKDVCTTPSLATDFLVISGDGLLSFSRLIAADLAEMTLKANNNNQLVTYSVKLSEKGRQLIHAWKKGDRVAVQNALRPASAEHVLTNVN